MLREKLFIKKKNTLRCSPIKIGKIVLFSILALTTLSSYAIESKYLKIFDLDKDIYRPLKDIKDLSFEIHNDNLKSLVEAKALVDKFEKFYGVVFWLPEQQDINLVGAKGIEKGSLEVIKDVYRQKAHIVWGGSLKDWLAGYEFKKLDKRWYIFSDISGLKDISEIRIKRKGQNVTLIEKKGVGTIRTTLTFKRTQWSNKKLVLSKVKRISFEGTQTQTVHTFIKYKKTDGIFWLPSLIKNQTFQRLMLTNSKDVEREIKETYYLKNYKVNQKESLRWFSRKK